jgi:hypothetical protein
VRQKDGGTFEYAFEAGEQNSPHAVTKEKAAEIAADFMTTLICPSPDTPTGGGKWIMSLRIRRTGMAIVAAALRVNDVTTQTHESTIFSFQVDRIQRDRRNGEPNPSLKLMLVLASPFLTVPVAMISFSTRNNEIT